MLHTVFLKESHYSLSNSQVHLRAADWIVRHSLFCPLNTCIYSQQTDRHWSFTWGLFKALSSRRLQIHCLQICIPQKVLQSFQDDRSSYLCQETDGNSPKKFCPIIRWVHSEGELTHVFISALCLPA